MHDDRPQARIFHWHCAAGEILNLRCADLHRLLTHVDGRPELAATERAVFAVFSGVGDSFRLAWVEGGRVHSIGDELAARRATRERTCDAWERLGAVCALHRDARRYEAFISGRRVTVVPSRRYACDLERAIVEVLV